MAPIDRPALDYRALPVQHLHLLAPLPAKAAKREAGTSSRAKVSKACGCCQKAHTSCDAARPCSRCVRRGEADLCADAPRKTPRTSLAAATPCPTYPALRPLRPLLPKPLRTLVIRNAGETDAASPAPSSTPTPLFTIAPDAMPSSSSSPAPFFLFPEDDLPAFPTANNHTATSNSKRIIPPCHIPKPISTDSAVPGTFVYDNVDTTWLDMLLHPPTTTIQPPPGAIVNFDFGLMNWLNVGTTPTVPAPSALSQTHQIGSLSDAEVTRLLDEMSGTTGTTATMSGALSPMDTLHPPLQQQPQFQHELQQQQPLHPLLQHPINHDLMLPSLHAVAASSSTSHTNHTPPVRSCPVKSRRTAAMAGPAKTATDGSNLVTIDSFFSDLEHLLAAPPPSIHAAPGTAPPARGLLDKSVTGNDLKSFSSDDVSAWIDAWGKEIQEEAFGKSGCGVGCSDCPFHDKDLEW
ncbi:hypothetical protein HDU98_002640 [Podochytrium sp. JEL0797]|nr:hypothetical protein HDU98_002640 [Podochytrium sp. JEL0797]